MNINQLYNTINTIGYTGNTLSNEEVVLLKNSLLLLQNDNHFQNIFFWGSIFGTENDYYIAYGYTNDVMKSQIYYYSTNCIEWGLLPKPTEMTKILTPFCITRFQGDPSLVVDVFNPKVPKDQGDGTEEIPNKLKEEDRLATTINLINLESAVVPRGALFKRTDGVIVENKCFEGLSSSEAHELKSYLHFREPYLKWNTNLLTRPDYNYALDFLDTIDKDIPKCWSLQIINGNTIALLNSLYWPGQSLYQTINTPDYGTLYFGYGRKNLDIPFML